MTTTNGSGRQREAGLRRCTETVTLMAIAGALLASLLTASSAAASTTYFVAPTGSDVITCAANTHANPFATIQAALACTTDGDAVSLAPSGGTPYPGVGAVTDDVTIAAEPGANARTVRVDVSPTPGAMSVPGGASVTVQGVTLACEVGLSTGLACGPNVTNNGTLTLRRDAVVGSTAGPGIANFSPNGGAADLTVISSTISDNPNGEGSIPGGGIESALAPGTTTAQDPSLTVANSTIADNGAGALRGGGIDIAKGSATVINSTITGNQASGQGGGGIGTVPGVSVELSNTIVAGNTSSTGPDCLSPTPPPMTSPRIIDGPGGHNLIGDGTDCVTLTNGTNGDQVGVPNPGLNPLANNGGPTDTVGLQTSSPAIAAADLTTCQDSPISGLDQRGDPRNGAEGCDIGAYDTGGDGGIVNHTYFVAPTGSDAITCAANTHANPFATIQAALACTTDGDVVSLAPSGGTDYPGVGAVTHNVTIEAEAGTNARTVKVDVSPTPGAMSVPSNASVTVEGVSLLCEAGLNGSNPCGPNITNHGTLTLRADTVRGSVSGPGIVNLSPDGGSADLTVLDSTISDNPNFAGTFGGGIESAFDSGTSTPQNPSVTVANSTIADNGIGGGNVIRGGGLDVNQGSATVINSTISGNHASSQGGGGIGASANDVTVELSNTVVAGNTALQGPDCLSPTPPPMTSPRIIDGPGGHNLIGDGTDCVTLTNGTNGDQVGVPNPGLNPLANNGGPTDTVGLQASSPAIAAADLTTCQDPPISGLDQRGEARGASSCDIGAFEAVAVTVATDAGSNVTIGQSIHDTATVGHGQSPTGTITFHVYGPNDPTCSGPAVFSDTKSVSGRGQYVSAGYTPTTVGTYRWIADYSGDTNNVPVPGGCNAPGESVTVAKMAPALTTTASPSVTLGGNVHDTAHLTGGHAPTSQITFRLYGPGDATCTKAPVFTTAKPVSGNGNYASAAFIPTKLGTYHWTAGYSGDANNTPAGSGCGATGESVTVSKASPTLTTTASPSVALGGKAHDTARLTGGHAPTGRLTFRLYGPGDTTCSKAPRFVTTNTVSGNGMYRSDDFTPNAVGTYRWRATYSGDPGNRAVLGTCNAPGESVSVTRSK
jgi:hypothetical protein